MGAKHKNPRNQLAMNQAIDKESRYYEAHAKQLMTAEQLATIKHIIHLSSVSALGVAMVPLPFADAVVLTPIQINMLSQIYQAFGQKPTEGFIKGLVIQTLVPNLGRSLAGNLLKLVPGVGSAIGAGINGLVAISITEAMGWGTALLLAKKIDVNASELLTTVQDALLRKQ